MNRLLMAGFLSVAASFSTIGHATEGPSILGSGSDSCGQWTKEFRNDSNLIFGLRMWVRGYVTSFNVWVLQSGNVPQGTDNNGILAWVDNYCAANPLNDVETAARALLVELAKRRARPGQNSN